MAPRNFRIKIEPGKFYHIWNRGNNRENLFYSSRNYEYFIRLYAEYLDPVAETYAFCLLPNHFHLLIRTKSTAVSTAVSPVGETAKKNETNLVETAKTTKTNLVETTKTSKSNPVSLAFQRFFTAYSQAINIQERRTGSLFQKPFKRLEVTTTRQLANLGQYIHTNPQKHKITDDFRQYPWSSYERIMRDKPSKLKKEEVLQWFRNKENYVKYHARTLDLDDLKDIIIE